MPKLCPFHPITFNPAAGPDLSRLIAPPYDVLDEEPKRRLLETDPHNIVAIDLPVTPPKTVGPDEAYETAGAAFRRWLKDGVLVRGDRPAVVTCEQRYEHGGRTIRRRGLFATLAVQDFNRPGGIFRHEMTIQGGIDDRYKLMAATEAQLSPVFGIHRDPTGRVAALLGPVLDGEPEFRGTTGHDGVEHRCSRVTDAGVIAAVVRHFADTEVFIADGHHRYTTALRYARDHPRHGDAQRCLFVLVAAEDEGMIVLPTHRVITGLSGFSMQRLRAIVARRSDTRLVEPPGRFDLLDPAGGPMIGVETDADPLAPVAPLQPEVWRRLDVAVLHEHFIDRILRPEFGGEAVGFKYTADLEQVAAMASADGGRGRLGVVMRPATLESVMSVSLAGAVMPPKSTYFYPKLATGLAMHAW